MKLAVTNSQFTASLSTLVALPSTGLVDAQPYYVGSESTAYVFYVNAKEGVGLRPNNLSPSDLGRWILDQSILIPYAVANDYDFAGNLATDVTSNAKLSLLEFRLGGYIPTENDINQIYLLSTEGVFKRFLDSISRFGFRAKISNLFDAVGRVNETVTFTIQGAAFNADSTVTISGWEGEIASVEVSQDCTQITASVLVGPNAGTFPIYVYNNGAAAFAGNFEATSLPTGPEKYLRVVNQPDSYLAQFAFARTFRNNRPPEDAFDNNTGTYHQCQFFQEVGHYAGVLMSQDTLLTQFGIFQTDFSDQFTVQGSNDTTTGLDGNWVNLQTFTNVQSQILYPITLTDTYLAFRVVWDNPSFFVVGAREIYFVGRQ